MTDNTNSFQSLLNALNTPKEQSRTQSREPRRKVSGRKKISNTPPVVYESIQETDSYTNMFENPMFMNLFNSLMGQVEDIPEEVSIPYKVDNIVVPVEIIDDVNNQRYLVSHKYPSGNHGYISYRGNYRDATRHALVCLGREHGMFDGVPDEEQYLIKREPIYTLKTDRVLIELIPYGSRSSFEEE